MAVSLRALVQGSRAAAGDDHVPIEPGGPPEVAEVARPFNRTLEARRRAEAERRALEEQVRQSQRLEALGRLAGGIAHDFNNILTVVRGEADLLATRLRPGDSKAARNVDQIRKATDKASDLTRQLLAFGRREPGDPQRVDLNDVVRELETMVQRLIGETVRLETDLAEELRPVRVDPGQLEHVLMNLVVNARDAMPGGGTIRIATRNVDDGVALSVEDTAEGMEPEVRNRIFEPFFTTKPPGEGSGLGLSTAYGIVSRSGGRIAVDTAPGEGSTFRMVFPAG